jgi:hypothetical protein
MNKAEWLSIIEQEESEIFLVSLVEDIIKSVENILFEKRMASMLLPYTLEFASKEIIETIEVFVKLISNI